MNDKIGIIGLGFVGDALKNGLEHFGFTNIFTYDVKLPETSISDVIYTDMVFICVPTPMKTGGSIDDSIVENTLQQLQDLNYSGIAIIKSTLLPTSVRKFINQFNINIATNPEFLTERRAREDFINTEWILIGGEKEHTSKIKKLYQELYKNAPQIIQYAEVTAESAMMAKYMTNSWFSVKVSLMNEYRQIWEFLQCCGEVHGNWEELVNAFSLDKRVGPTHLQVPGPDGDFGFGGKCFPKDLNALMSLARENDIQTSVMSAAWDDNIKYRRNKDWLNIDGAVVKNYVEK